MLGNGITPADISLTLSEGSVIVVATVVAPSRAAAAAAAYRLSSSSESSLSNSLGVAVVSFTEPSVELVAVAPPSTPPPLPPSQPRAEAPAGIGGAIAAVVSFVVVFLAGVLVGYLWHRDQKQKAFNAELQAKALAIAGKANQYV